MSLDDVDKQIIRELFNNGRLSLTALNKRIFKDNKELMSHTGIKKRITKLHNSEILKVQGNVNVRNLDYKIMFILLEMKNFDEIKKISKAYLECPRVFLLAQVSGQFNLILGIIGQSVEVLHRYINFCGPTNKDGILHSQILYVSHIQVPEYFPVKLFSKESKEHVCGNVCKDCEAFLDGKCDGCGNF
jgi:DNA-binding Lrp family transcriptional regulator